MSSSRILCLRYRVFGSAQTPINHSLNTMNLEDYLNQIAIQGPVVTFLQLPSNTKLVLVTERSQSDVSSATLRHQNRSLSGAEVTIIYCHKHNNTSWLYPYFFAILLYEFRQLGELKAILAVFENFYLRQPFFSKIPLLHLDCNPP